MTSLQPIPRGKLIPTGVVIAVLTLLIFGEALNAGFLSWGDAQTITANPRIPPSDAGELLELIITPVRGLAAPLAMLSHAAAAGIGGSDPLVHHAANLLLHALNTILLFLIAVVLFGQTATDGVPAGAPRSTVILSGAVAAAVLFGWHPLRVEPVAWVSGRAELLAGTFLFGGVLLFLLRGSAARWFVLLFFVASMASHPVGAASPLIAVGLGFFLAGEARPGHTHARIFGIAALAGMIILLTLSGTEPEGRLALSVPERIMLGIHRIAFTVWKSLAPFPLAPAYPVPDLPARLAGGVTILLLTALAVGYRKRVPSALLAWGSMLILLLPLSILLPGQQPLADRYAYLAGAPVALAAGGGILVLLARAGERRRSIITALLALPLLLLGWQSYTQTRLWSTPELLWRQAVRSGPKVPLAHFEHAAALEAAGKGAEARAEYERTLQLSPTYVHAHLGLSRLQYESGNLQAALLHATRALQLDTLSAPGWNMRGMVLYRGGRKDEARKSFRAAQILRPRDPLAYINMALVDLTDRAGNAALVQLGEALAREADTALVLPYRATAHLLLRNEPAALADLERLTALRPGGPSPAARLADIHVRLRDTVAALRVLREAAAAGDTTAEGALRHLVPAPPDPAR